MTDTDAERRAAEEAVEEGTEAAAEEVVAETEAAQEAVEDAPAEDSQTIQAVATELATRRQDIVNEHAQKIADKAGISVEAARLAVEREIDTAVEHMHTAHAGANPSPAVAAAATGAVSGAAGAAGEHVAKQALPDEDGNGDGDGDGGGEGEPATDATGATGEETTKDPPAQPDQAPKAEHWSERRIGRRKNRG